MASTSKPVAVAAGMVLLDECRPRLDESVEAWLPELADRRVLKRIDSPLDDTVPARRPITVRDVLTSTFGPGMDLTSLGTPIMGAVFRQAAPAAPAASRPNRRPPAPHWPATTSTCRSVRERAQRPRRRKSAAWSRAQSAYEKAGRPVSRAISSVRGSGWSTSRA